MPKKAKHTLASAYRVILADPPWKFDDKLPGDGRGAEKHYGVLKQHEIETFLSSHGVGVEADAWLFLWRVAAMQEEALRVVDMWGFEVTSEIVWVKTTPCKHCAGVGYWVDEQDGTKVWCDHCEAGWRIRIGMGHTVRNSHEVCLVCRTGKPKTFDHSLPSVVIAQRQEHSKKPAVVYDLIERLTGNVGPRIELFARERRPHWDSIGDELP